MEWNLTKRQHQKRREDLQALAARSIGRLLKSLEVTNFVSLRSYYTALVRSQLYSFNFSQFSSEEYERAQKIFLQQVFSLPSSFPIKLACFFMGLPDFKTSVFDSRTRFLARLTEQGSIASLASMVMDRDELFPLNIGWNSELLDVIEPLVDLKDVDLTDADEVEEARDKLQYELKTETVRHFRESASCFIMDFFPHATIPRDFAIFLGNLPYESVRILLIFMANMFQFTYLRSVKRKCPFCSGQLSSEHFFLCPHTPPPFNNWVALIGEFQSREYWKAMDRIFLTLQRWAAVCNRFTPGFGAKIEEYFHCTENKAGR
jgi:hypothetical protein